MGIAIHMGHDDILNTLCYARFEITDQPRWDLSVFFACWLDDDSIVTTLMGHFSSIIVNARDCMVRNMIFLVELQLISCLEKHSATCLFRKS